MVINIFHLHILYEKYYTGIDRYLEMYENGISNDSDIISHTIFLTNNPRVLFPKIEINSGKISAIIPMPLSQTLLFEDFFWKKKYLKVINDILEPFLVNKKNLIFQYHNLFLSNLAEEMRNKFGGKILTHLHCLPWKFNMNEKVKLFNELYQLNEETKYEEFNKLEKSVINYNVSDSIICLSQVAKDYLVKIHKIDSKKVHLIFNGLDIKNFTLNKQSKVTDVEILYVGKLSKDKGTFELLDALKDVKLRGYSFKLKMAGTYSVKDLKMIKDEYRDLDVTILGQLPLQELQKLYTSCTMGIIPSLHEQCSYVALEMALFGVPMIVSDVDALSEMFEHEKNALKIPFVFDEDFGLEARREKFAENIIRLIEDKELRMSLGSNAHKLYMEKFTIDKMISETIKVYKQLI